MDIFVFYDFQRKILLFITTLSRHLLVFLPAIILVVNITHTTSFEKKTRGTREKYSKLNLSHVTYANTGKDLCIRSTDNNFDARTVKISNMIPFCFSKCNPLCNNW